MKQKIQNRRFEPSFAKTALCSRDTSLAPLVKANSLSLEFLQNSNNNFVASLQRYQLSSADSITVFGFDFYAVFDYDEAAPTMISTVVNCNMFGIDSLGRPAYANPLASVAVTIDTSGIEESSLSSLLRTVTFPTPVTLNGSFYLEVKATSSTEFVRVARSGVSIDGAPGDGLEYDDGWYNLILNEQEGLSPGRGINGSTQTGETVVWDVDNLLHPHVEFSITADFELVDGSCLPHGETVIFENTSSSLTGNRYFNVFSLFNAIAGDPDSTWLWIADVNDTTSATNWGTLDYVTSYSAPTTVANPGLEVFELGYSRLCRDGVEKQFVSGPVADAEFGFTVDSARTVTFTNNSTGSAFWWDFGDGDTSTQTLPVHTYDSAGTYLVTLVASHPTGACSDTLALEVNVSNATGIMDDFLNARVNVFPNPSTGLFTLEIALDQVEEIRAEVRNMLGQKVATVGPRHLQSGEIVLDLSGKQSGIYVMTLWSNGRQISRKLSLK